MTFCQTQQDSHVSYTNEYQKFNSVLKILGPATFYITPTWTGQPSLYWSQTSLPSNHYNAEGPTESHLFREKHSPSERQRVAILTAYLEKTRLSQPWISANWDFFWDSKFYEEHFKNQTSFQLMFQQLTRPVNTILNKHLNVRMFSQLLIYLSERVSFTFALILILTSWPLRYLLKDAPEIQLYDSLLPLASSSPPVVQKWENVDILQTIRLKNHWQRNVSTHTRVRCHTQNTTNSIHMVYRCIVPTTDILIHIWWVCEPSYSIKGHIHFCMVYVYHFDYYSTCPHVHKVYCKCALLTTKNLFIWRACVILIREL